ncbi:hypothetical protein [Candidatus Methylomicrobium oryzae]|nr:hypothetical protein [Methylomicrobium sp. RS1]MBL1266073.1 hypothetical protein [Methylomicrobium sp. RS1]
MKPKTLFDIKVQEATDFIKLPFFLDALAHSPPTLQRIRKLQRIFFAIG